MGIDLAGRKLGLAMDNGITPGTTREVAIAFSEDSLGNDKHSRQCV